MSKPARPAKRNTSNSAQLRALQLLGRWARLAQGHVILGTSCSCGAGVGSVPVADLEQDILNYLRSRHAGSSPELDALFVGEAGSRSGPTKLVELLRAIASADAGLESFGAVLRDLEQSIESFERTHRT